MITQELKIRIDPQAAQIIINLLPWKMEEEPVSYTLTAHPYKITALLATSPAKFSIEKDSKLLAYATSLEEAQSFAQKDYEAYITQGISQIYFSLNLQLFRDSMVFVSKPTEELD